jgi:hypothetical protein
MNISFSIVELIQLMLAPGIMISACGLLLLGMNNKYSIVVGRIRNLNEEKRKLSNQSDHKDFSYQQNVRIESIYRQLGLLLNRVRLVRNAVLSYTIAIGFFILTSLFIGLSFTGIIFLIDKFISSTFLIGMVSVLCGITFAAIETIRGYEIIQLEIKIDE